LSNGRSNARIHSDMVKPQLESYLKTLPTRPGIYIFRDGRDEVIYIGKALNLRNRVKSYFKQVSNLPEKTAQLVERVEKIDFVITESELAALMLECQQIKRYRPHYNVLLKDDKSFPYIKVDVKSDWPTISITRKRYNDGAKYIGRVPSAWSARQTYELIKRIFPLRSCNKVISGTETRPCLKYHIQRCYGPCIGAISREQYHDVVRQIVAFLEGREDQLLRELKKNMQAAAAGMEFEKAAEYRNQIQAVEAVVASHKIPFNIRGELDVIGLARDGDVACVRIFSIKDSRLKGDEHFIVENARGETDSDIIEGFVKLFYSSMDHVPPLILVQAPLNEPQLINDWLKERRGSLLEIRVPVKGTGLRLLEVTAENARQQLDIYKAKQANKPENMAVLAGLQNALGLSQSPHRIEGYDISNIQGTSAVGSMVVFENGVQRPTYYRRFKIQSVPHSDDYAMMREMLQRRFKGHSDDEKKWGTPDLVLIDGGKGHLSAAVAALMEAGATDIPVISIAKENEDIFQPGRTGPVPLDKSSHELHLLQRIRDEAHRFAVTYHRNLRSKKGKESLLDSIQGVGPARKKALVKKFGSVKGIRAASLEELSAVDGITEKLARQILEQLE
jgi:excinuclease ABC subunit C